MHLLGRPSEVNFSEKRLVVRMLAEPSVFFLENAGIIPLHWVVVGSVLAISGDLVDEEEGENLDALRAQALFLVKMLLDGSPDHLALYRERVNVAPCFSGLEILLTARYTQFHIFVALCYANFANAAVSVDGALRRLLKVIAVLHDRFASLHARSSLYVQLYLGADDVSFVGDRDKTDKWLVMRGVYCGGSDLNLLNQLAFIGVHRVEAENHVVLVPMGSRIAQCAERVHGVEGLLPAPFQPTIDALRFIDNDN